MSGLTKPLLAPIASMDLNIQQLPIFQWKGEIQEFCPNTKMLLVGCKSDLRTDVSTLVELSNHRQTPVSYDQVGATSFFGLQGGRSSSFLSLEPSLWPTSAS